MRCRESRPGFHERLLQITSTINPVALEGAAALGGADNNLYAAEALVRAGYPANRITDFLAANLAASQGGDGGWHLPGYSRSPLQDSDFSRTAMAMRALKTYGTPGRSAEMKQRLERGKQWLMHAQPVILEDMDMRLAGVAAAGASAAELRKLAEPILALQRPDGGWAQRQGFPSDAYATGMTLWALDEAGVMHPDAKGVKFLLGTQSADGSWHVVSRATKFQQYFESGFPYGHDQWISTMATGWAANALALVARALTVRPAYLTGQVRDVFLVIAANKIQQIGVERDDLVQLDRPRFRVGLRIVHRNLDFHVSEVDAPEPFRDSGCIRHRIARSIEPHAVAETARLDD